MDFVHPIEALIPGTQGRVLSALAGTTAELNLRAIARVAGVSVAQCSRVMPRLVEIGLVERREVPPSSQFRLVRRHLAAGPLLQLAGAREALLAHMSVTLRSLSTPPVSVVVFGSFARGEAVADSDIDVLVVRPSGVSEDDSQWSTELDQWRTEVSLLAGNSVDVLQFGLDDAKARAASRSPLWTNVRREGVVVHGVTIERLVEL